NLFVDLKNAMSPTVPPVAWWAMGVRLYDSVGAEVHHNTFRSVQSVNIQLTRTVDANVPHNDTDGITPPGTGTAGIQLAATISSLVRDNLITNMDSGLLITPNNATSSSMVCNTVSNSTRGIYAQGFPNPGAHTMGPVLHNRLIGNNNAIQTNWDP